MLSSILGFKGRLGRLNYFLSCLGLGLALVVAFVVLVLVVGYHPGAEPKANLMAVGVAVVITAPLWLWTSLSLQACRIRDIGWNPVLVIVGFCALSVLDRLAAAAAPALAMGRLHQNTAFGLLLNLGFAGVLLFWPGKPDGAGLESRWEAAFPPEPGPQPLPEVRATVMPPLRPATAAQGFGRRGL